MKSGLFGSSFCWCDGNVPNALMILLVFDYVQLSTAREPSKKCVAIDFVMCHDAANPELLQLHAARGTKRTALNGRAARDNFG